MGSKGFFKTIVFLVYLAMGIYFLNEPFKFIPLPDITKWVIFVGGILLIFGGMKYIIASHSFFGSNY